MTRLEQYIIVVVRINSHRNSKLAQVVQAFDAFTLFLSLGKGGQKHAGQDGDNGNHHKELNERKATLEEASNRANANR